MMDTSLNLRTLLAELGDRLVHEHGFQPANLHGRSAFFNHTLEPLVRFLVWLEHTPEAGFVLQQMGVWQLSPARAASPPEAPRSRKEPA